MSVNPRNTEVATRSQLESRVANLEQQRFQEDLNAQFRDMQVSQSLQYLQYELLQMKRAFERHIPELRRDLCVLGAKHEIEQNIEATRNVHIEPRTQEQKLESAMRNANLIRISAAVSLPGKLTVEQASIRGAEQMESLAKTLRSRVHRGGAAYVLEAEDAEVWAAKLRGDATPTENSTSQPQGKKDLSSGNMPVAHDLDDSWGEVRVPSPSDEAEAFKNASDSEAARDDSNQLVEADHGVEISLEVVTDYRSIIAVSMISRSSSSVMIRASFLSDSDSPSTTTDKRAPAHGSPIRITSPGPRRRHASARSGRSKTPSSAVSVKLEETAASDYSSPKSSGRSDTRLSMSRGRKLAPHQKYGTHKAGATQIMALEPGFSAKVEASLSRTDSTRAVAEEVTEAQVPANRVRKLTPHQRLTPQQAETSETPAKKETTIDMATSTYEIAESAEAQVPVIIERGRAPHQRHAVQQAESLKTRSPTIKTPAESEKSTISAVNTHEVAQATEAQVPTTRAKKLPPHRKHITRQVEAPKLPRAELKKTDEEKASSSETVGPESSSFERFGSRKMKEHMDRRAAEAKIIQIALRDEQVVNQELQESISPLDIATQVDGKDAAADQTWQPAYLNELSSLSAEELEGIPSVEKMHHFDRSFILNHLGGSRWLPSFYSIPEDEITLLPGRGFYLLEDSTEPLAPATPGSHGSLLTPVLRLPDADNPDAPNPSTMENAPLFLRQGDGYIYYGMYTYLRADRLDIERCNLTIPASVKSFWADQLTTSQRPKWVTEALQKHLLPQPLYTGPLPHNADDDKISLALSTHLSAITTWHKDTHLKTSFLRPEHILAAFEASDIGAEMPGIRFWGLGLRCEGWDEAFYNMMVREEGIWEKEGKRDGEGERGRKRDMLWTLRARSKRPKKW
ncbi:hypothetical protein E4T38_03091 [Aureobasidium subglaciale]|nr:hypothetical protein E4T38_03091 [Aureobasidium subglaciale]KAI5226853.1 hypothetical protein E4T40_02865 [Aureobasidium subglaciale]KAI5230183.1 hypothetical protein E4T41_03088 [Aureobasidium subglaciale]KAI5264686.1 hypothetical protein E4T46_02866 [Aureobasidium subglaciale]